MKKTTKGMVSIPTMTPNALKNMLFSSEGGIDLSKEHGDLVRKNEREKMLSLTFKCWMEMDTNVANVLAKMKK